MLRVLLKCDMDTKRFSTRIGNIGQYKNEALHQEYLYTIAEKIALRTGLLTKCPIHEKIYDRCEGEYEAAYRLANSLITQCDQLVAPFNGNRQQLTDLIQVICNKYGDSCSFCERNAED